MSDPSRADQFMASHCDLLSHDDANPPLNTECPICLEGIEEHVCVKIVGVPSCNHLIGYECIKPFLDNHPNRKKLCPICRTEWLPDLPGVSNSDDTDDIQAIIDEIYQRMDESSRDLRRRMREQRERLRQTRGEDLPGHERITPGMAEARRLSNIDMLSFDSYPDGRSTRPDDRGSSRPRTPPLYSTARLHTRPGSLFESAHTRHGQPSSSGAPRSPRFVSFAELSSAPPDALFGPPPTATERSNRSNPPSSARYTDLPSFTGLGSGEESETAGDSHMHRPAGPSRRASSSFSRPHRYMGASHEAAHARPVSPPITPARMFNSMNGSSRRNTGPSANGERPLHTLTELSEELREIDAAVTDLTQRFNAFAGRDSRRRGSGA